MELLFVSTNKGKYEELKHAFSKWGVSLKLKEIEIDELDEGTLEHIAEDKARKAYEIVKQSLMAEDTGIFFDAYDSFPGVNAKKVWQQIGFEGLLKKLEGKVRTGHFDTVICYIDENGKSHLFKDTMKGIFLEEVKEAENHGLPFKRIFQPEGWDKPFSEFTPDEIVGVSQRAKAAKKLARYLRKFQ